MEKSEADNRPTLYDRVISDPKAKEAFYNTTDGLLTGNPAESEVQAALSKLDETCSAYFFTPDDLILRPIYRSGPRTAVGADEIATLLDSRLTS